MESICHDIGINAQHLSETVVRGRYQLICDKQWLQTLEQKRKIGTFPIHPQLDSRAHPTGALEHPWTRILVQTYQKRPQLRVFPLPQSPTEFSLDAHTSDPELHSTPLTYSQAVIWVANTNFKNLWEAAHKQYQGTLVKPCRQSNAGKYPSSPDWDLLPYDVILKELIQRVFCCPVIHSRLDRLKDSNVGESTSATINEPYEVPLATSSQCHGNVLPAIIGIETASHFSVFFYPPAIVTSLYDCITYSPAVLNKSYNKPLFLIYQIFQLLRAFHTMGLFLGEVRLHDILVHDNLWIQVLPNLEANLLQLTIDDSAQMVTSASEGGNCAETDPSTAYEMDGIGGLDEEDAEAECSKFDLNFAYNLDQFSLREYCEMWCNGQLSNYDYLTILNNAAGRSLSNPAYHHIMPWVTDFSARNGANWRDLSKSKYRLNKGDVQLDLMFSLAFHQNSLAGGSTDSYNESQLSVGEVPHHVSDFLSEITYFVYMARRTPQHILCEHVRPIWVPAEYPVTIQRLQQWTPDECIPAFYSDPMIFKSIHEDLADLELPAWASCPEDFISKHREALESQYVSERLQHWIDLNFGYKLTGKAAVKSKNVFLSLVDQHKHICQRGIVQLFTQPHPPKRVPSPWFSRTAPRLTQLLNVSRTRSRSPKNRNRLIPSTSKRLAKSIENLYSAEMHGDTGTSSSRSTSGASPRLSLRTHNTSSKDDDSQSSSFYQSTNFIELPKDYNPLTLLQSLETMQTFFARTFPKQKSLESAQEKMVTNDLMFDEHFDDHSFTNQLFVDRTTGPSTAQVKLKPKSLLAPSANSLKKRTLRSMLNEKRDQELQVTGCLIVELFAMQRLRPLLLNGNSYPFSKRLQACRTVAELYKHDIPKALRYIVGSLLQQQPQELVTHNGLPPPSTAQILEPIFANFLIPFPNNYYPIYALIRSLHAFDFNSTLLELHTHFNCNGKECSKYIEIDRKRVLFERKIAECKVMSCCAHIGELLEPIAYEQFTSVELLLPHIADLLNGEQTSILTAWNLFDTFAQALGIANTRKYLLPLVMKLYDVESFERGGNSFPIPLRGSNSDNTPGPLRFSTSSSFKSRKSVKLYHHSFLLRLIVRFGLNCFLQNFMTPLIEAVGGYKEPEEGNGFHFHSTSGDTVRRASKNLNYVIADEENSVTLISSNIAEAETELEDTTLSGNTSGANLKPEIEDVFSFDDDGNSDHISNSGTAENKSIDSFDMRPAQAEEAREDFNQADITPEKLAISEIIYGSKISNASFDDADKISLKSQTVNDSPTTQHGPKSPTIAIPSNVFRRTYHLNTIDCDIGSRRSVDSFEIITQAAEEEQKEISTQNTSAIAIGARSGTEPERDEACDSLQASVISKLSEAKAAQNNRISEMSAESLVWLSHRLGPTLTSRFITRNLLKMLSLCYVGQENLLPETATQDEIGKLNYFSIADARVVGDRSAARVLECLMSIAALYGEEVILLQYFPHMSELVTLSVKRITGSLEGAIISILQLLKYIVPCLMDATLMDHLKDIILDSILLPIIHLLGSTKILMPSGYLGRSVLARKLLDAIYTLCVRIGPEMSKDHLCIPALRPFFLIFDKAFGVLANFCSINSTAAISPPNNNMSEAKPNNSERLRGFSRENEEMRDVFSPALAHIAYLSFLRFLGESIMQRTLLNLEFILTLCHEFEQPDYKCTNANTIIGTADTVDYPTSHHSTQEEPCAANSFGTQIVGNRIEVMSPIATTAATQELGQMEVLDMVAYKFEQISTTRHLKGNWLAYWRHEISRPDKDTMLNLKQIRLQSFVGHTNSVRAILALDNENSFISASKDKTVKLWSLRSEGDGKKASACQFTYTAHKKSIHSLAFLEAMRFVVSCDSGVHVWDPFIGRPLGILDSHKHNPVTVVKCLPSPSPLIVAGTADASVRIIDTRCMQYVNDWRVQTTAQYNATVRCLTVAPSGHWIAAGLSSGSIVTLDTRTGVLLNSWRPMECDLLQLAAPNDQQLVSSALDHSLAVWLAADGILHYQLKPPVEPAHFLQTIGSELVYATTGNRIGIYADIGSSHAIHNVVKLRSETFRGVLTSLAVLPLQRTFLAGNESGNIVLLC